MPENFSSTFLTRVRKTLSGIPIMPGSRILAGVSGGVDSMTLLFVLKELGYQITAAHVNFQLRGDESDLDKDLVETFCRTKEIHFLQKSVDTNTYAKKNKLNTQLAAREIRYQWWSELMQSGLYDFVATAHHADDHIETLFINLFRGTGIKGMQGIPVHRGDYIRPLLRISRNEIETFAETFQIPFRTDRSNETDDYLRNRIRHYLMPVVFDLAPNIEASLRHSVKRMALEWNAWEEAFNRWEKRNVQPHGEGYKIETTEQQNAFLLRWLEKTGMPWSLVYDFVYAVLPDSGKEILYKSNRLIRIKGGFYFEKIAPAESVIITQPGIFSFSAGELIIESTDINSFTKESGPMLEYINAGAVRWPLILRHVQEGDRFMPFGMHGKQKKLQDFLVDLKLDGLEKSGIRILTSPDHILWVIGYRIDERVRITESTTEVFKLEYRRK